MAIETAVMEQLLQQMLKTYQQQGKEQAAAFAKIAKASGLDPKVIATAESKLKALGDSAEETAKSTSKMSKAGSVVGSALADLTSGVMATVGNLGKFASTTLSGNAKMSDMILAFKDLPIIGTVASLFSSLAKLQEENISLYRNLSSSGINFGVELTDLRGQFLELNLTSDEYTKILKSNADIFALMGSSVSNGARNFRTVNKELLSTDRQLVNLGFSYSELSSLTASYARVVGGLSKQQQQDTAAVTKSVVAYGKELDLLSRLTGQDRESLQKKLEAAQQEENWQAFLSTLPKEASEKLKTVIAQVEATTGEAGVQNAKARASNNAVLGDAGQLMASLASSTVSVINKAVDDALNANVSVTKFTADNAKRIGTLQFNSAKDLKSLQPVLMSLQLAADPIAGQFGAMLKNVTLLNNQNITTLNQAIDRAVEEGKIQQADADKAKKQLDAQLKAEKAIQAFSEAMNKLTEPLITGLLVPVMNHLSINTGKFSKLMEEAIPHIKTFIDNLFSPEGRQRIVDGIGNLLADLMKAIFSAAGSKLFHQREDVSKLQNFLNSVNSINPFAYGAAAMGMEVWGPDKRPPQQQSPAVQQIPAGRSAGSWGTVGSAFENFGSGTPLIGHGNHEEGMFTVGQINKLMAAGTENNLKELISQLNNTQAELVYQMRQVAENSRRNVQATESLSGNAFA